METSRLTTAQTVTTIEERITSLLTTIVGKDLQGFECAGAFIFLGMSHNGLLEPVFNTLNLSYDRLRSVNANTDETGIAGNYGIASYANRYGQAYSSNPREDPRFGQEAIESRDSFYKISGSMMAVRIGDSVPAATVIVVHSNDVLKHDAFEETRVDHLRVLVDELELGELLTRWQCSVVEESVNKLSAVFPVIQHGLTGVATEYRFQEVLKTVLPADVVWVHTSKDGVLFPTALNEVELDALRDFSARLLPPGRMQAALNREGQDAPLYTALSEASGLRGAVWGGVQITTKETKTTCIVARRPASIVDQWSANDLFLLAHMCELYHFHISRSKSFVHVLRLIAKREEGMQHDAQWELLCYLLLELFGIDQVLLMTIDRRPDGYRISSAHDRGFDQRKAMYSRTKVYNSDDLVPDKPDITIRILVDYLDGHGKEVYEAEVGQDSDSFSLDPLLAGSGKVKGRFWLVPCCVTDPDCDNELAAILHVGRGDGNLSIEREAYPLLFTLAGFIGAWSVSRRKATISNKIRAIRDTKELTLSSLTLMCSHVATATQSLGVSLFVNCQALRCLDNRCTYSEFERVFIRLCATVEQWKELFKEQSDKLVWHFSSFFGIDTNEFEGFMTPQEAVHLGHFMARYCYVRVAKSGTELKLNKLGQLLKQQSTMNDESIAQEFGHYFLNNMYLPGFGLTGWVLRHKCPMSVSDKRAETLHLFFEKTRREGWVTPQDALEIADVVSVYGHPLKSKLGEVTIGAPFYANNIPLDSTRKSIDDAYMACPLEDVDGLGQPLGVLRASYCTNLRQSFDREADKVVNIAANHLSSVFRKKSVEDEYRVKRALIEKTSEFHSRHFYNRVYETVTSLNRLVVAVEETLMAGDQLSADQLESVKDLSRWLGEVADDALNIPHKYESAACILDEEQLDQHIVVQGHIERWMSISRSGIEVVVDDNVSCPTGIRKGEILLSVCELLEEITKNYCRYEKGRVPTILIGDGSAIFVGEIGAAREARTHSGLWSDYRELDSSGRIRKGGMRLVEDAAAVASVTQMRDSNEVLVVKVSLK